MVVNFGEVKGGLGSVCVRLPLERECLVLQNNLAKFPFDIVACLNVILIFLPPVNNGTGRRG